MMIDESLVNNKQNPLQKSKDEQMDPMEKFKNYIQQQKDRLTYQALADTSNLYQKRERNNNEGQQQQSMKANDKILAFYQSKLKEIKEIQNAAAIDFLQKQIDQKKEYLDKLRQQNSQLKLTQLLNSQTQLHQHLTQSTQHFKTYLQTLFTRIKHQKYLNQQQAISDYIQRQQQCMREMKGQVQDVIDRRNEQLERMYAIANNVVEKMHKDVDSLKENKAELERQVKSNQERIKELNEFQKKTYLDIDKASTLIVHLSAKTKNQSKLNKQERVIGQSAPQLSNQRQFTAMNLGSNIQESIQPENKSPMSQILGLNSRPEPSMKKCEIKSDFNAVLKQRKLVIILLAILTIALCFL